MARDKCVVTARLILGLLCRDHALARKPANSARFAESREISVGVRLRGGHETTRTACQARSRYRTGLLLAATLLVCHLALDPQLFGSGRHMIGTRNINPDQRGCKDSCLCPKRSPAPRAACGGMRRFILDKEITNSFAREPLSHARTTLQHGSLRIQGSCSRPLVWQPFLPARARPRRRSHR